MNIYSEAVDIFKMPFFKNILGIVKIEIVILCLKISNLCQHTYSRLDFNQKSFIELSSRIISHVK